MNLIKGVGIGGAGPPISKQTLAALLEIDCSPRWAARVGRWLRELIDQTSPAIVEASIATGLEALAAGRLTSDLLAYIAKVARNRHNGRAPGKHQPPRGEKPRRDAPTTSRP